MKGTLSSVVAVVALLLVGGCSDGRTVLEPGAPQRALQGSSAGAPSVAQQLIPATGTFEANVDFSTLTFRPVGSNCLLEVEGQLIFSGTIEGEAVGRTRALVFAPCEEVLANPPGTFPDVFRFEAQFEGTVDGVPVQARLVYLGRAEAGGQIEGRILLSNAVQAVLQVDAQLAVGGTYAGVVLLK